MLNKQTKNTKKEKQDKDVTANCSTCYKAREQSTMGYIPEEPCLHWISWEVSGEVAFRLTHRHENDFLG